MKSKFINSKSFLGQKFLDLPEAIEEEWQIVVIIKLFDFNFPCYSVSFCVVL